MYLYFHKYIYIFHQNLQFSHQNIQFIQIFQQQIYVLFFHQNIQFVHQIIQYFHLNIQFLSRKTYNFVHQNLQFSYQNERWLCSILNLSTSHELGYCIVLTRHCICTCDKYHMNSFFPTGFNKFVFQFTFQ